MLHKKLNWINSHPDLDYYLDPNSYPKIDPDFYADSDPDLEPDPDLDLDCDSDPKLKPDRDLDLDSEPDLESALDSYLDPNCYLKIDPDFDVDSDPDTYPDLEPDPHPDLDLDPDLDPDLFPSRRLPSSSFSSWNTGLWVRTRTGHPVWTEVPLNVGSVVAAEFVDVKKGHLVEKSFTLFTSRFCLLLVNSPCEWPGLAGPFSPKYISTYQNPKDSGSLSCECSGGNPGSFIYPDRS